MYLIIRHVLTVTTQSSLFWVYLVPNMELWSLQFKVCSFFLLNCYFGACFCYFGYVKKLMYYSQHDCCVYAQDKISKGRISTIDVKLGEIGLEMKYRDEHIRDLFHTPCHHCSGMIDKYSIVHTEHTLKERLRALRHEMSDATLKQVCDTRTAVEKVMDGRVCFALLSYIASMDDHCIL